MNNIITLWKNCLLVASITITIAHTETSYDCYLFSFLLYTQFKVIDFNHLIIYKSN